MQRPNLKRKRSTGISESPSQLKITKYLDISPSAPVNQKIQIRPSNVVKETIQSQLIRHNLDEILSDGNEIAADSQTISHPESNTDSCRNFDKQVFGNNVEEHPDLDDESFHSTKYWKERAKYFEKEAKKYKEQFDFTNKLLNRKLRQIDSMKKELESKPEAKNASRMLIYHRFEKYCSEDSMYLLRSVQPGKQHDRKFVKYALKSLYENREEVIQERTFSGRTKQKITPEKLKNIKSLFQERIDSEKGDHESKQTRYEYLNQHISNTLVELRNQYKTKLNKTNESAISNVLDIDNPQLIPNINMSASIFPQQVGIIKDQSISTNNQSFLICSPVNHNLHWNSGLLLNSVENMPINLTPHINPMNGGKFEL